MHQRDNTFYDLHVQQAQRVAAFEAFARHVATAGDPAPEHQVEMTSAAYETFPTLSQKV